MNLISQVELADDLQIRELTMLAEVSVGTLARKRGLKLERLRIGYAVRTAGGRYLYTTATLGAALDLILTASIRDPDDGVLIEEAPPLGGELVTP